uniref:Uncharacterized protein n=1 Tax=Romanomermis culicivorax TaxID=13658 RepID=A0A915IFB4_ROMCU
MAAVISAIKNYRRQKQSGSLLRTNEKVQPKNIKLLILPLCSTMGRFYAKIAPEACPTCLINGLTVSKHEAEKIIRRHKLIDEHMDQSVFMYRVNDKGHWTATTVCQLEDSCTLAVVLLHSSDLRASKAENDAQSRAKPKSLSGHKLTGIDPNPIGSAIQDPTIGVFYMLIWFRFSQKNPNRKNLMRGKQSVAKKRMTREYRSRKSQGRRKPTVSETDAVNFPQPVIAKMDELRGVSRVAVNGNNPSRSKRIVGKLDGRGATYSIMHTADEINKKRSKDTASRQWRKFDDGAAAPVVSPTTIGEEKIKESCQKTKEKN